MFASLLTYYCAGNRGIGYLHLHGELANAAVRLAKAKHVLILVGFPCVLTAPYGESDGPPGALALARTLQALGIKVKSL